jgi:UDP-N-acetylglucosamine--N-acetylmuramyl-(pentapeptide) pyrophosphoryl-undecaprenol N-acetylglucosamine transferase
MLKTKKILIGTGGTGGHIFPAVALAQQLEKKYSKQGILFAGGKLSNNPYFSLSSYESKDISCAPLTMRISWSNVKSFFTITKGVFQSLALLIKFKPDVVIGFGSYHTFPLLVASKLLLKPIILHEGNKIPGKVNRLFSPLAKVIGTHFKTTESLLKGRCVNVGFPLRQGYTSTLSVPQKARSKLGLSPNLLTLLVFGGSQGALGINMKFLEAVWELSDFVNHFQVIHLTGNKPFEKEVRKAYEKLNLRAFVASFESQMDLVWTAADLTISRAGACSIAEMVEFEVPAILVPYPSSSENHQVENANFLANEIRGGVVLEEEHLDGKKLAQIIKQLIHNDRKLINEMKESLREYKMQKKTRDLRSIVYEIIGD